MFLRIVIFVAVIGAVIYGVRSIMNDWKKQFQKQDKQNRDQDLKERQRPDVLELERGDDGVYRPAGSKKDRVDHD